MLFSYSHVSFGRCSSAEQKMNIPEGFLKKEVKSKAQKQKELEDVRKFLLNSTRKLDLTSFCLLHRKTGGQKKKDCKFCNDMHKNLISV